MSIHWWLERLRDRGADQAEALRIAQTAARRELQAALGEYDAFVEPARRIRDGLLLGTAASSAGESIPVRLPWGKELRHWVVNGSTGCGKTTWVASILRQEILAGRAVGLVDGKGDLYETGLRWVAAIARSLAPEARERLRNQLTIVNWFSPYLVPFNVCQPIPGIPVESQAFDVTLAFSRLFEAGLGPHMENILRHTVLLLSESGLTLVEAPLILQDDLLRGLLVRRSTNPTVREFFLGTWPAIPQVSKDALLSRLGGFLFPENVRLSLGADRLLDLRAVLDQGAPAYVFHGKGPGVPEEQTRVLASLYIQFLLMAVFARGTGRARPYLLIMDEFSHLLDAPALARRFETALTTARSYGLGLALVGQSFAQVPPTLREIILGNCDLVAMFRTSSRNAEHLGEFLPEIDPGLVARARAEGKQAIPREETRRHQLEALQRLPDRHCFWYDRGRPHRAILLRVPDLPDPHDVAGVSAGALDETIRSEGWDRGGFALPRSELRAQIEARRHRLKELLHPPIRITNLPRAEESPDATPPRRRRPKLG